MAQTSTQKSTLPDLGVAENKQWYELHPDRLAEEIKLMREAHPSFSFHQKGGGNVYWEGRAVAAKPDGSELLSLNIKIECLPGYPTVFPVVHDVDGVFTPKFCPHLIKQSGETFSLCYGNRLDAQLNFLVGARIKDVTDYASVFLFRQWHYQRYGEWPDGHAHGAKAFLDHEIAYGPIEPKSLCPCGMNTKTYEQCHQKEVILFLAKFDANLGNTIKIPKIGRNDLCPCKKGKKYKKCCLGLYPNYENSKGFLALKYPSLIGQQTSQRPVPHRISDAKMAVLS